MKKLYSLLLFAVVSVLCFNTSAKTLTIKATVDNAAYVVDQTSGNVVPLTTAGTAVTFESDGPLVIKSNTGWLISSMKGTVTFDYSSNPTDDTSSRGAVTYPLADGSELLVEVVDASQISVPTIILRGDKDAYYASYNYASLYPDENGEIKITDLGNTLTIYARDGYKLVSAASDKGDTFSPQGSYISFYTGIYSSGETVVSVETMDMSQVETSTFTAEVVGLSYKCYIYDTNYNYYYFNDASQTITFMEGDSFTVSSQYGTLYKIELNGEPVATSWTSYSFKPSAGDKLTIYTEFPDIDVNFGVSFAEGCDAGVVKEFRYDNNLLDASVWASGSWTPKLGKTINLSFNVADYTDVKMRLNGVETSIDTYSSYQTITLSEEEYTLVISGTRQSGYHTTIVVSDPDHITAYKGYSSYNNPLALDGEITEIELSRSDASSGIQFVPAPGYKITALTVIPTPQSQIYNNMVYVDTDGTTIEVEVEEIIRDKKLAVFVGPGEWNYLDFTLGSNNNDYRTQYNLTGGYTVVNFCTEDIANGVYLSGYPTPIVYLNGIECKNNYGAYSGLDGISDGDVLKIFQETPASHSLSYEIDEDVNVLVTHDRVTVVDTPAQHTVFAGTEVSLTPAGMFAAEPATGVVVKVNDADLTPVDGVYTFTVNGDTSVSVQKDVEAGVENVALSTEEGADIYNLQGVCVGKDFESLPSGIYIVKGRKIRK